MLIKKIRNGLRRYAERLKMNRLWILLKLGKFNNNDRITKLVFSEEWENRIAKVMHSDYNAYVPRVRDAGQIVDGFQKMHNGIAIATGDYYGLPIAKMLYLNKGVHEPEEEKIFQNILPKLPARPVMIEMGAYWAFYSMWFLKNTVEGNAFMIEPNKKNLIVGQKNFKANNLSGSFNNYFMGSSSMMKGSPPIISLDEFINIKGLKQVNIAHSDIQGYEFEMLMGATESLKKRIIDYFLISTHSNSLHYDCIKLIEKAGYQVLFDIDLDNVSSLDGFIVAVSPNMSKEAKEIF